MPKEAPRPRPSAPMQRWRMRAELVLSDAEGRSTPPVVFSDVAGLQPGLPAQVMRPGV